MGFLNFGLSFLMFELWNLYLGIQKFRWSQRSKKIFDLSGKGLQIFQPKVLFGQNFGTPRYKIFFKFICIRAVKIINFA